jgi:hypothetical protein
VPESLPQRHAFVVCDHAEPSPFEKLLHGLKTLFGGKGAAPRARMEAAAIAKVEALVESVPRSGVRVYRTRGGLRYLLTHGRPNPGSPETLKAMQTLGADPLYVRLCRAQECFRARLTPKPWRCGVSSLNIRYPYLDRQAENRVREWTERYARRAEKFATCNLIAHLGSSAMDPLVARVVEYHDDKSKIGSGLPLA